ncbi:quinate 5-dehydrogenase [Heliorestis acidaminivorans]|uniref:Quinate 5-dehydrogenase n=1 Tax=Heliorestis acidaminivorans TaxID=553427 RepID=A0A6I0EXT1_9FIRM|nr:quinate 5-dehydrogenase [Heliorestis acidaminivorans]KAB2953100.1 quinate 5-dehydrogenase [Heliorestis acidaminivorans]
MKKVVSVSLGSSKRNHHVQLSLLGQEVSIERIGTDGDMEQAIHLIKNLDGKVDAIGLGGIDLYIFAGKKRYLLKDGERLARAARITPVVDGSGLKNTLERRVVYQLAQEGIVYEGQRVLIVCAVDRFGLAESFSDLGCQTTYGDLFFALGLPIPIKRLTTLNRWARLLIPLIRQLPFRYLYPTGAEQDKKSTIQVPFFRDADLIAGDFHYIKPYLSNHLGGKVVLTNTVTADDVDLLKGSGVKTLITTTPEIEGRSFGTNVMEALLIALASPGQKQFSKETYESLLEKIGFQPRIDNYYCCETETA